jgi:hypothetical protein
MLAWKSHADLLGRVPAYVFLSFRVLELVSVPVRRTAPVFRIFTQFHITMKRRLRPISHRCDQSVFQWIDMDVINTALQILFIPTRVFPETALPQPALTFVITTLCDCSFNVAVASPKAGEDTLNPANASGVIGIPSGNFHDHMEMSGSKTIAVSVNG